MSSEAVIKKKTELCRQLVEHLKNSGVQDPDFGILVQALDTAPAESGTAVLSNTVIMKYKEKFDGDSSAVLKRWILLN